jgi:CheY-like chemotaxis protein
MQDGPCFVIPVKNIACNGKLAYENTSPLRIFVIDDEPVIAETVVAILRLNGFSASSFSNTFDVLNSAQSDAPDLLISDVTMPKLFGIELSIRMKGYDFNLLQKPVYPKDLLDRIRTIEAERSLRAHPATMLEGAAN